MHACKICYLNLNLNPAFYSCCEGQGWLQRSQAPTLFCRVQLHRAASLALFCRVELQSRGVQGQLQCASVLQPNAVRCRTATAGLQLCRAQARDCRLLQSAALLLVGRGGAQLPRHGCRALLGSLPPPSGPSPASTIRSCLLLVRVPAAPSQGQSATGLRSYWKFEKMLRM